MADDENTPAPPASEATEPPSGEPSATEGERKEEVPEKAAVKTPAKKTAPRKKAARTKAVKAKPEKSGTAAAAAESGRNIEKPIKPTVKDTGPDSPPGKPQEPPKRFWWKALLMIAVVIFLFSTIRDMAKTPEVKTAVLGNAPAIISTMPDEVASSVASGNMVVEEAPSQPPADNAIPAPGSYSNPYQRPHGMYRWPQPGGMPGLHMYPMTPYGGYYAYPQQYPWPAPRYWSPYYYYWSPLYYPLAPPSAPAPEKQ